MYLGALLITFSTFLFCLVQTHHHFEVCFLRYVYLYHRCFTYSLLKILQEGRRIQVLTANGIQEIEKIFFRPYDAQCAKQLSPLTCFIFEIYLMRIEYEATVFTNFLLHFNYKPKKRAIIHY